MDSVDTDTEGMLHTPSNLSESDPAFDRRQNVDRRVTWRGGRRDSDWITRPRGALEFMEREAPRMAAWWRRQTPRSSKVR